MAEIHVERRIIALEESLKTLQPSKTYGGCHIDALNVIQHLTGNKMCKEGSVRRITPGDVDSPGDRLLIYATQAGGYTQVDFHDVALMDDELVVDIGRKPGNRVFPEQEYYSLLTRLQR